MVEKCLECKYFKEGENGHLGRCMLYGNQMYPNETCSNFTANEEKESNCSSNDKRIEELEARIDKLERLFMKLL